jgi:hypothetical protein
MDESKEKYTIENTYNMIVETHNWSFIKRLNSMKQVSQPDSWF